MGQFSNVLLAIDKAHTVPQRAPDYGPDLGGLNQQHVCQLLPPLLSWQLTTLSWHITSPSYHMTSPSNM